MNPTNDTVLESEFVYRRMGESFTQFRSDLWGSLVDGPLWVLIPAIIAIAARVWYGRHYRKVHGPAKPDATMFWLGWAGIILTTAFVGYWLYEFHARDSAQLRAGVTQLTSLGDSNKRSWRIFTAALFAAGAVYVAIQYVRDSRSVRWFWAVKLALLRTTVYAVLCLVFLLPARQTWEKTQKDSSVLVLIDISPSMTRVSDDLAKGTTATKRRMEYLIEFLTDKDVQFVQNILKTNHVRIYPFGTRLDEFDDTRELKKPTPGEAPKAWGTADWQALATYDFRPFLLKGLSQPGKDALSNATNPVDFKAGPKPTPGVDRIEPGNWADWAAKWFEKKGDAVLVNGLSEGDTKVLRDNLEKLERRIDVARSIALGTNVPDSVAAAINRESPNRVQGVVVFSDMRSNLGSDSSYRELRAAATREKVPVFMVAVGEDRQATGITITDVQTDDVASPDEGFKVSVEADGHNLAGKTVPVELEVYLPGNDPKNEKPNYTFRDSRADKTKGSATPYTITFAPGDPPHGQAEFVIDPAKLAAEPDADARKLVTESKDAAIKKPVLIEGAWSVRARIPRDENEAFKDEFHVRERPGIQVIQKKIRVLAIAGAPNREFQFLRTFLSREVQENRATLTLLVQNEAGTKGQLTPNPTETIIARFPNKLDLSGKVIDPAEKQYNLNEYDVIVAFDPDWTEVSQQQAEDLRLWVERQGGGFLLVADRINTYQLARVEANSRLSPVLDILPVAPDDVIAVRIKRTPTTPRRLYLNAMPASDLLKIDDPPPTEKKADEKEPANDPIAGWERFFTDRDKYAESKDLKVELYPRRGFFSCYPVKAENGVKPGAHILAEFAELDETNQPIRRPYFVVSNPSAAFRTAYLGSGEIYRMYAYDREYYERFWAKTIKYLAAKRNVKASRGRVLTSKDVIAGTPIRVTSQVLATNSKPYPPGAIDPKFSVMQIATNGEKKLHGPFPMTPTGVEGYYRGQVVADPKVFPAGEFEYYAVVEVPDSAGETLTSKFSVVKSDLEMDVTKPDLAAWLAMASPFDDGMQAGVPDSVKATFVANLPKDAGTPKLAFKLSDRALLKLIPDCFKFRPDKQDLRGPVEDLWDERVALLDIDSPDRQKWLHDRLGFRDTVEKNERAATPFRDFFSKGPRVFRDASDDGPPRDADGKLIEARPPSAQITISWVLLVVALLLCWEWLTRKLLRLA